MEKYQKLLRLLNKLKKKSKASDKTIAAFTDGALTSQQVSRLLAGSDESDLSLAHMKALEKGVVAAHNAYFTKLIQKINKKMRQLSDEDTASEL